jgi:hypothetical protein
VPPQLSETWAAAYVQILITLVVFALGIPALAIQFVVQDDIREVFRRRMRITGWVTSLVVILLAFIAFVWFLHPPFKKVSSAPTYRPVEADKQVLVSLPLTVNTSPAMSPGSTAQDPIVAIGNPIVSVPGLAGEDENSYMGSLIASVIMTLIPLILIGLGLIQITYLRRQNMIKELEKEIIEDFTAEQTLRKGLQLRLVKLRDWLFKKRPSSKKGKKKKRAGPRVARQKAHDLQARVSHPLEEETLRDLIFLGRSAKAGRDKKLVLDSLNRISFIVQDSATYQGGELEDLIPGIKDIVLNGEQPGGDEDFNHAIVILKGIRHRLSQKKHTANKYLDAGLVTIMLEDLGVEAVKNKSVRTAERFLEEASSSSKTVFKMGLTALDGKQFHTATLSLNRLESLAGSKDLTACPETFDLLGLIAHFIATGIASRMRADQFLSENFQAFTPSIDDCLEGAYKHHYSSSNFETADKILDLRQKIKSKRWSPLLLVSI